jgi:hypothetical protein
MKTSGRKTGGGPRSVTVKHNRYDSHAKRGEAVRHEGAAQIGSSTGNHATDSTKTLHRAAEKVRGAQRPAGSPGGVMLGNAAALNVGCGGVGTGRVNYGKAGTNAQHGPVEGSKIPPNRPLFDGWPSKGR